MSKQKNCNVYAIIAAGGSSSRFQGIHKLLYPLNGISSLEKTLQLFEEHPLVNGIILILHPSIKDHVPLERYKKILKVVEGGSTRQESILKGLDAMSEWAGASSKILVHDAARPFVSPDLISQVAKELDSFQGVVPVIPLHDALKSFASQKLSSRDPGAGPTYRTQTPQGFWFSILYACATKARSSQDVFRDEVDMVLALAPEATMKTIPGEFTNEKITSIEQISLLEKLSISPVSTGIGYDFHYFQEHKPLVLGGISIPFEHGLEGDSDGDVLTHSILDGLLGALSLGDMGRFFGVGTPELKGAKSVTLIHSLQLHCKKMGIHFAVQHIDLTLVALKPPLSSYIPDMSDELANWLNCPSHCINIKSTTDKGMDAAGSGKGIRSIALVSIYIKQGEKA